MTAEKLPGQIAREVDSAHARAAAGEQPALPWNRLPNGVTTCGYLEAAQTGGAFGPWIVRRTNGNAINHKFPITNIVAAQLFAEKVLDDDTAPFRKALEAENARLRDALSCLQKAQQQMLDGWAEGDDKVKTHLWQELHKAGKQAFDVLCEARAAKPSLDTLAIHLAEWQDAANAPEKCPECGAPFKESDRPILDAGRVPQSVTHRFHCGAWITIYPNPGGVEKRFGNGGSGSTCIPNQLTQARARVRQLEWERDRVLAALNEFSESVARTYAKAEAAHASCDDSHISSRAGHLAIIRKEGADRPFRPGEMIAVTEEDRARAIAEAGAQP